MTDFRFSSFRFSSWARTFFVTINIIVIYFFSLTLSGVSYISVGIIGNIIGPIFDYEDFPENDPLVMTICILTYVFAAIFPLLIIMYKTNWLTNISLKQLKAEEVNENLMPNLHKLMQIISIKAGIPKPKLYVINSSEINACAMGNNPNNGIIILYKGLLDKLDNRELLGVIAHEIAHIKNRDTLTNVVVMQLLRLSIIIPSIVSAIFAIWGLSGINSVDKEERDSSIGIIMIAGLIAAWTALIGFIGKILVMSMSRTREFAADRTGARLSGDPEGLISALIKISEESKSVKVKKIPQTSHIMIFNMESNKHLCNRLLSDHPTIERRINRLRKLNITSSTSVPQQLELPET